MRIILAWPTANLFPPSSFIPQSFHWIKFGGACRRIEAGDQTYNQREDERAQHQPPGHGPECFRRQLLPVHVNVAPGVYDLSDHPTQDDSHHSADDAHGAGFCEEQLLHIQVPRSQRLENADFAPSLEDSHYECVDDAERCHCQRQAAKDAEKEVEDSEKYLQIARGINQRKGAKSHVMDGVLHSWHIAGVSHAHTDLSVGTTQTAFLSQGGWQHDLKPLGEIQ